MKRLIAAFFFSLQGLKAAFKEEAAFRQECIATLFLVPLAFYYSIDKISLILMIGSWILVLIVELLNSGIEAAIDRMGLEKHPLSKKAKDVASAAVFLALVLACFTWFSLLL